MVGKGKAVPQVLHSQLLPRSTLQRSRHSSEKVRGREKGSSKSLSKREKLLQELEAVQRDIERKKSRKHHTS